MNTIDLTHDIHIEQPAERVWSVIADYARDREWRTGVVPGRSFSWRTTSGADAHGSRSVEPVGAHSCRVRLELHVRPRGSRGVERLLAPMLRRMMDRNLRGDLERLAAMIRSEDGARVP